MQKIFPHYDSYTLVALLKACAKRKDFKRGSELHAAVASMGLLSTDVFVGSAVVAMYAKCADLEKAQEVFDQLPIKTIVTWNALIDGYTKQGYNETAFHLLKKMQLDGFTPNAITFICLLKTCTSIEALETASEIHVEIARKGLLKESSNLCCALVDMYMKVGLMRRAQELSDQIPNRCINTWNALISGYAKNMCGDEALQCLERMQLEGIHPDQITFSCSLKACGDTGAAEIGCQIHAEIARKGLLETDVHLGSFLVNMYFKCGLLAQAQEAFDKLAVRDVVSWTTLITGYADRDHAAEALQCYEQMQLEGLSADSITYTCSLKACGNIEAVAEGRKILAEIERRGLLDSDVFVGHAVVDMYAKCSLLERAMEVFNRIKNPDVVLWNVLIAGYTKYDRCEEVFSCLESMQHEGANPDAITYACSVKACGTLGDADRGRQMHAEVETKGGLTEGNLSVGNALIDMYGKCNCVAEAHTVLHSLPSRDIISWNTIIAVYTEHLHGNEALHCYEQMQSEGLSPNNITFTSILKACSSSQVADTALGIHSELMKRGPLIEDADLVVSSTLIEAYGKCGFLYEAQEVFDKLSFPTTHSWNALIAVYLEKGLGEEALEVFKQMQQEGILMDDITFTLGLKACGSVGSTQKARDIHAEIERIGYLGSNIVGIALVDVYVKLCLLMQAQEVLYKLSVQEVATWNALIFGFAQQGCGEDAIKCLQKMQLEGTHPDAVTITGILKACGSTRAGQKGREIHAVFGNQRFFLKNPAVGNSVVDMYAKCGWLKAAVELFENLPIQNTVSWNVLIAAYANSDYDVESLACFKHMQSDGVPPDAITLACTLKACGSIGELSMGTEIHVEIERKGLMDTDCLVGNALVDMYVKHGILTKAQEVFDSLPVRDVVSWNTLMTGYMNNDQSEEVLRCAEQMQREDIHLDAVSYVCILRACGSVGALEQGGEMHIEIERQGLLKKDLSVSNSIIDMYVKSGLLKMAMEVFNGLTERDIMSWNALITGHAQIADTDTVFDILEQMEGGSARPDSVTSLSVLTGCNHDGLIDAAESYFIVICTNSHVSPTVEHYTCMVDLLGRAGQLDRAAIFIREIPFHLDTVMLCSVLGACRKWHIVELAQQAFEHAMVCDENDTTAHKYMLNIYKDAGMQNGVLGHSVGDHVPNCLKHFGRAS